MAGGGGPRIHDHRLQRTPETLREADQPGDIFLCYLTGKSRFIGVLRATSDVFHDTTPVWESQTFPTRFGLSESTCSGFSATGSVPHSRSSPRPPSTPACCVCRICLRCSPTSTSPSTSWLLTNAATTCTERSADRPSLGSNGSCMKSAGTSRSPSSRRQSIATTTPFATCARTSSSPSQNPWRDDG